MRMKWYGKDDETNARILWLIFVAKAYARDNPWIVDAVRELEEMDQPQGLL